MAEEVPFEPYELKEGDFRVIVHIHECRDLKPRENIAMNWNPLGDKAGSADPLCTVKVLG